jgi:hypothetical protein
VKNQGPSDQLDYWPELGFWLDELKATFNGAHEEFFKGAGTDDSQVRFTAFPIILLLMGLCQ